MADEKIFTINVQKNIEDCRKAFKSKNILKAFSIYNDLTVEDQRMLLPDVASFYASVMDAYYEYGCLMRMIAYPKSHRVDPIVIMHRLSKFVVPLAGNDYLGYYQRLIEKTFGVKFDVPLSTKELMDFLSENESKKPNFELILGKDGGEYFYHKAIECVGAGDIKGAKANLKEIKKEDSFYINAQKYLAFITQNEGNSRETVKILKRVLQLNPNDKEALKRLESVAGDYDDLIDEVCSFLLKLKFDEDNTEANILIAKLLSEKGDWQGVVDSLKKVKDINMYSEHYLMIMAEAYFGLGDLEKCKEYLKSVVTIYPKNVKARYKLRSIELGDLKGLNNYNEFSEVKQMTIEAEKFLDETTEEDFAKLNLTELTYYFRTICYYGSDVTFKKACLVMLTIPKMRNVMMDALLEIETSEKQKEIIFSTLVQLKIADKIPVLIFGKLKTINVKYPKNLFNEQYANELTKKANVVRGKKASFLLYMVNAYSQAFTVRVFEEGKLTTFHKNAEKLVNGLLNLSEEQLALFQNLDNLVFAFCLADDEKYLTKKTSFVTIRTSVRQTISLYLQLFMGVSYDSEGKKESTKHSNEDLKIINKDDDE